MYSQADSKDSDQTVDVQTDISLHWVHILSFRISCALKSHKKY